MGGVVVWKWVGLSVFLVQFQVILQAVEDYKKLNCRFSSCHLSQLVNWVIITRTSNHTQLFDPFWFRFSVLKHKRALLVLSPRTGLCLSSLLVDTVMLLSCMHHVFCFYYSERKGTAHTSTLTYSHQPAYRCCWASQAEHQKHLILIHLLQNLNRDRCKQMRCACGSVCVCMCYALNSLSAERYLDLCL